MNQKTIAITGASGFIGSYLVPALCDRGAVLHVLSRTLRTRSNGFGLKVLQGDLLDPASLQRFVEGADAVLHLGGYAHAASKPHAREIAKHRQINLEGTRNLFRSAVHAGVRRFVFVSSVKAGGEDPDNCLDETSVGVVPDGYGAVKRQTEGWLFEQGAKVGVEISVLRPTLIYGSGVKGSLAAMLRGIDRGRLPPLPETHNVRSMVSVQDVVAALLAAAERPEAVGQVCILTDGESYSTRRIYVAMAAALDKRVPGWSLPPALLRILGKAGDLGESLLHRPLPFNTSLAARLLDSACYRSVNAERCLGFRPRYRLEDLLPDMVRAYRQKK